MLLNVISINPLLVSLKSTESGNLEHKNFATATLCLEMSAQFKQLTAQTNTWTDAFSST